MSRNPSVSLTGQQQKFVSRLVKSGRYRGVSDVMRAGLRLLEEREDQQGALIRSIEEAVKIGLKSGPAAPMESAGELAADFRKRRAKSG